MNNLLNFCIFCACIVYKTGCMPMTGPQWTEPKAKGNITLILIPQENSDCNDSDVIVAVKSDCKVLSQDMQLLNLIVKDNQTKNKNDSNPSCNGSLTIQPPRRCSTSTTEINQGIENHNKYWNSAYYFKPDKIFTFLNGSKSKIETPTVDNISNNYNTTGSIHSNTSSKDESGDVLKFLEMLKKKAEFIETSTINYKDNLSEINSSRKEIIDKIVKLLEVLNISSNNIDTKKENDNTSKMSLNFSEQDENKLFLDLFNISLNKENNERNNNASLTQSMVNISEPKTLSNTFLRGAVNVFNRLKNNPSSHRSLSNDNDKLIKREESKNNPQNINSDVEDSALKIDEEDNLDYSASETKEGSNNNTNLNTDDSNYTTSMCLPFFIDFNSTGIGSVGSNVPISINYNVTENPIQLGSSEETQSFESTSLISREMMTINNSNNVSTIDNNIVQSQSNNGKVKLTSYLDQNEENPNFENQWPLSVEKQHPEGIEIPNEEIICTTIIVKCVPVQRNEVFEQISKIVNSPTSETESSEIRNTVGDTGPGIGSTPTVLTECFPVKSGNIDLPVTNAMLVKKITIEPPVDCASHSNVRGKLIFDIITE